MGSRRRLALLAAGLALSAGLVGSAVAAKDDTILVSRATATAGAKGNATSLTPSISADGRFVAFESQASNLHPADPDATRDIFVRDMQMGTTTLVSRAAGAAGPKGNDSSFDPAISADGRFVAFHSSASNLHPDDADFTLDVFVRDLQTHTTTLVSRATGAAGAKGNFASVDASISADGRSVAFRSDATNLHPDDTDAGLDVFVRDLQASTTTLASRATGPAGAKGNSHSHEPEISADGHSVAFTSRASNLHPDDTDFTFDVFVRDLQSDTTTLASRAAGAAGAKGNADSDSPSISSDGHSVAFRSQATNLHPDDTDATRDVFLRDLKASTTTLASRATGGRAMGAKGNLSSDAPSTSADGGVVAFESNSTNLHPHDSDTNRDIFVRDLQARRGTTTLASRATGPAGAKGNGDSFDASTSGDGRFVAFASAASNLDPDDPDPTLDVFVRDLQADSTTLVSRASGGGPKGNDVSDVPSISSDGRFVAFMSRATNLDPDDTDDLWDVFVRDVQAGATTLFSRASGSRGSAGAKGNSHSTFPSISADGRAVAFTSDATNLHPDDTDTVRDVFVRAVLRRSATTTLVSRATGAAGAKGNDDSVEPSISADRRFVAFHSAATNLDPDDTDTTLDVFVRDLHTDTTTLVSRATGAAGAKGNGNSHFPSISSDGRFVAFRSGASNLHPDDSDAFEDVLVRDLQTNATTLVSRATGATGAKGNGNSDWPSISADGRLVAFHSGASNLHPDDTDTITDVFVRDLQTNTTTLASRATGAAGAKGTGSSFVPSISADGRSVAFHSGANNLHPDDPDTFWDVLVRNLQTSTTTLASRATGAAGAKGDLLSESASISADGRFVAFGSGATNLHPDDTDFITDVFVRDLLGPLMPPA